MKQDLLNYTEIKKRYNNQWVLIVDPVYDKTNKIVKGKILFHGENRENLDKVMLKSKGKKIAIRYLGKLDKNLSVIL
jgi:hypothetical protein